MAGEAWGGRRDGCGPGRLSPCCQSPRSRKRSLPLPCPPPPQPRPRPSSADGDPVLGRGRRARAHAAAPDFRFVSLPARTDCLTGQRPGSPQSAFGLDMPVSFPPMMRLGKSLFLLTKADLVKVKLSGNIYIYKYFFFFSFRMRTFPRGTVQPCSLDNQL